MVIAQGDLWWATLNRPAGSEAGYDRPVIVVQGDVFNRSRLRTVVCVPLTSNTTWSAAPGNILVRAASTGLDQDSVANAALVLAVDRSHLIERIGRLDARQLDRVLTGIDLVLGR